MEKVRLYFLRDNAGYLVIADHDSYIMILNNNSDLYLDQVRNHREYLENIEDDSSWEYMEKDVLEGILANCEILKTIAREL